MKTILRLVAFALALAGFVLPGLGQDHRFYHPLTIAPAPAEPAAGGSGMQDEAEKQTQLLKDSLNPVAALISVPIQKDWDFGIGPLEGMRYTARVQPVIPFGLNKDWNLITRTILPII